MAQNNIHIGVIAYIPIFTFTWSCILTYLFYRKSLLIFFYQTVHGVGGDVSEEASPRPTVHAPGPTGSSGWIKFTKKEIKTRRRAEKRQRHTGLPGPRCPRLVNTTASTHSNFQLLFVFTKPAAQLIKRQPTWEMYSRRHRGLTDIVKRNKHLSKVSKIKKLQSYVRFNKKLIEQINDRRPSGHSVRARAAPSGDSETPRRLQITEHRLSITFTTSKNKTQLSE